MNVASMNKHAYHWGAVYLSMQTSNPEGGSVCRRRAAAMRMPLLRSTTTVEGRAASRIALRSAIEPGLY